MSDFVRMKRFALDHEIMEKIEAAAVNHPKPNLVVYDDDYLHESVPP